MTDSSLEAPSLAFGPSERASAERLVAAALAEDLGEAGDVTSRALIAEGDMGRVKVIARQAGVLAGEPVARMVFERIDPRVEWRTLIADGMAIEAGSVVAELAGPVRSLLTGERTALNFLTHLSGMASLARQYVDAVAGTSATIFDTRKTLPGWRAMQKYAVRAGGGTNHRIGLYDAVLIKDNHLAACERRGVGDASIAAAVRHARDAAPQGMVIEVEVDTLEQLEDALAGAPDIVLLDNMPLDTLREAVRLRDARSPGVLLEASGGVNRATVRAIAETGVERISIGALTHSAPATDLAFDWEPRPPA
ncbi:MAG: carboxylating nicotinate-nucleotide diphosphorylase [Planctomycetaceae bacterium]